MNPLSNRWKPYPAYKDSGVAWLGEMPAHWNSKPFKRIVDNLVDKGNGLELPFVALEHIVSGEGRLVPEYEWESKPANDYAAFQPGDVLFGKLRPYLRKFLHVDRRGCCPTELMVFRPQNKEILGRYLFYLVHSTRFISLTVATSYGTKMPRTSWEKLGPYYMWLPPLPEQHAIAAFLDRETAKLDALIAKKERLIELLQEKRAALISHAVTKGLDPDAPMKDSGVPWLGDVPAHWEVKRLKFVISFVTSGSRGWAQYYSNEGALFVRVGNVSGNSLIELDLEDVQYVIPPNGSEGERTLIDKGDVLIAITGATIGSVAVVSNDLGEAYVNQHVALTRPRRDVIVPRWLGYSLWSWAGQEQVGVLLYGGTKDGLGLDDVKNFVVFVPPLIEQNSIIAYLDQEASKFDNLIIKTRETIAKLQEYRTALITTAVTGNIDVREEGVAV